MVGTVASQHPDAQRSLLMSQHSVRRHDRRRHDPDFNLDLESDQEAMTSAFADLDAMRQRLTTAQDKQRREQKRCARAGRQVRRDRAKGIRASGTRSMTETSGANGRASTSPRRRIVQQQGDGADSRGRPPWTLPMRGRAEKDSSSKARDTGGPNAYSTDLYLCG